MDNINSSFARCIPDPQKKMIIFTREQGGQVHCQVDNLALPNGKMFDWLDEVWRNRTAK